MKKMLKRMSMLVHAGCSNGGSDDNGFTCIRKSS